MTGQTPGGNRKVVVSSKNFTEEFLLGEMYALALESAGVPVERKLNLGASDLAQAAMLKGGAGGGIDLYPEYTSTGLTVILKQDPIFDPPKVYDAVKKGYEEQFKITWLEPSPMNDTQAFVITKENSDKLGIKSLEDMCAKASQIRVSTTAEFKDRPDAYPRLKQVYGSCDFKELKSMDPGLFYKTLLNGDVEVTQAFSTDGPIAGNGLVLLADPKNYGLPYNVAPLVRDDVLATYPHITGTLNKLSPMITNDVISALNWEVDGKKRDYQDVAKEWMQKQGLIK
jgi:osmoprotectant transport system substrate-binding protein